MEVKTKHLRGGHYVVNNDFRIKTRLTGTRVWTVAESAEAARKSVLDQDDLTLDGPDYLVSSANIEMVGTLAQGETVTISAPIRNAGATRTNAVAVALVKQLGYGEELELARMYLEEVPLTGEVNASLAWKAAPGDHVLWVVVDPDGEAGDTNPENNRGAVSCSVPGDDAPPTVAFITPEQGATFNDSILAVEVEAKDATDVAMVTLKVDGGIGVDLSPHARAEPIRGPGAGAAGIAHADRHRDRRRRQQDEPVGAHRRGCAGAGRRDHQSRPGRTG